MDLDNRSYGYQPPQPPQPNRTPLVVGGVVAVAALVGLVAVGSGGGGPDPDAVQVVSGPGLRIQVPEYFTPQQLKKPEPYAKVVVGDPEDGVLVVVHVLEKDALPIAGITLDKMFQFFTESMEESDRITEIGETTSTYVGTLRGLQQEAKGKLDGRPTVGLFTLVEDLDRFYVIEVDVPSKSWGAWSARAKKITDSFELTPG